MSKLTDHELKEIIDYYNIQVKGKGKELSNKGRKGNKINEICKLFGIEGLNLDNKQVVKRKERNQNTLREFIKGVIKTFNKNVLDAIYASYKWPDAKRRWLEEIPLGDSITVTGTGFSFQPLYSPERNQVNGKQMLHKAIYFNWLGPELYCLLLGPPGFNCWLSFAPVFQWCCSIPKGSPGVGRNTFLSSPHLCFIIVFICDLFVSLDDPLMR